MLRIVDPSQIIYNQSSHLFVTINGYGVSPYGQEGQVSDRTRKSSTGSETTTVPLDLTKTDRSEVL